MFSKKNLTIVGLLIIITIILLLITTRYKYFYDAPGRPVIAFIGPMQKMVTYSIRSCQSVWKDYFYLLSVARENKQLKIKLKEADKEKNRFKETELANQRLRALLDFKKRVSSDLIAAEVIGRDISCWSKTIIIDKGRDHGVQKGFPVVIHRGIVGHIVNSADNYSKVLLIIDKNSSIDVLVQRTRARGIIKGESRLGFYLQYVLRKHDVATGDMIISSGLDGVYPKGFRIGTVSQIIKRNSGIFQEIKVTPHVDFEKLEEIFVLVKSSDLTFK
ncbi:Cell shape-determining protein MreC [Candidatus Magnetomoraceae bacterium gMMP-15]